MFYFILSFTYLFASDSFTNNCFIIYPATKTVIFEAKIETFGGNRFMWCWNLTVMFYFALIKLGYYSHSLWILC